MFQCNEQVEMNKFLYSLACTWITILDSQEALAIRHVFSLVDMITNTNFSNCTHVFKIGAVLQQNMQSKHQNTFHSNL